MNLNKDQVFDRVVEVLEAYVDRCLRGETPDLIAERTLPDGRNVCVVPIGLLRAQLAITAFPPLEKSIYQGVWEYKTQVQAIMACYEWDGQGTPPNWWRKTFPGSPPDYNKEFKD